MKRESILGVQISATNLRGAVAAISGWIRECVPTYVCVAPAHSIMDARSAPELLEVFNGSGMTTPDGMAIVWLLKLRGHREAGRVYGPDLMRAVCRASLRTGWRHFLFGGGEGVAEELQRRLEEEFPGVAIAGTYSPPFRPLTEAEDAEAVERIVTSRSDIVWVGLGSPKQDRWCAEHFGRVGAPVLIGVGAAFDFLSGRKSQAPTWVQDSGLEWLYRWLHEPRRLWPRYSRYPLFVWLALIETIRLRARSTH